MQITTTESIPGTEVVQILGIARGAPSELEISGEIYLLASRTS